MKKVFLLLVFCIIWLFSHAQKPADIQKGNLWLSNVKIDGKHNEWPKPLKAYNKATVCWYSIANDDKNLYVAIKSIRWGKIFSGGITATMDNASITFPVNKKRDRTKKENQGPKKPGDPSALSDFKEIGISGIDQISNPLISIYNQYGIKVVINEMYEKGDKFYEYEMAIPLKLLITNGLKNPINYTIKLDGIVMRPTGGILRAIPGRSAKEMMEIEESINDLSRVSQLSGKYTLATKPQ